MYSEMIGLVVLYIQNPTTFKIISYTYSILSNLIARKMNDPSECTDITPDKQKSMHLSGSWK